MLSFLSIRNLAVIDEIELEFEPGFTVLTGETGAGKSILLDGLQLALGGRADKSLVRAEAERAEIVAGFNALPEDLQGWLGEHELAADEELMLRRVVSADGRSRAWINGTPVPIQVLAELGAQLVEVHGQNEHQFLRRPAYQLRLLDACAGHAETLDRLGRVYRDWKGAQDELDRLRSETALSPAEREMLEFQVTELEQDALGPEDLEALEAEHRALAHAGDLLQAMSEAAEQLEGDRGDAATALARALKAIEEGCRYQPELEEVRQLLDSALIQAREAAAVLTRLQDAVDLDPDRLRAADDALARIHRLARKHRIEPTDLRARLDQLQQRLQRAAASDEEERALRQRIDDLESRYRAAAEDLSQSRRKAAANLARAVTATLAELGMSDGRMEIDVRHDPERPLGLTGLDEVEFRVTTNPGVAPGPLVKVASGGELSRICLAIKVVAGTGERQTMIFDEVDAGVGGGVAQIVGEKLRRVARDRQVFSVTHLPQVAACAHHQFRILKRTESGRSVTRVEALDDAERVDEVARMLGGLDITERTTEHAREMIEAGRSSDA